MPSRTGTYVLYYRTVPNPWVIFDWRAIRYRTHITCFDCQHKIYQHTFLRHTSLLLSAPFTIHFDAFIYCLSVWLFILLPPKLLLFLKTFVCADARLLCRCSCEFDGNRSEIHIHKGIFLCFFYIFSHYKMNRLIIFFASQCIYLIPYPGLGERSGRLRRRLGKRMSRPPPARGV